MPTEANAAAFRPVIHCPLSPREMDGISMRANRPPVRVRAPAPHSAVLARHAFPASHPLLDENGRAATCFLRTDPTADLRAAVRAIGPSAHFVDPDFLPGPRSLLGTGNPGDGRARTERPGAGGVGRRKEEKVAVTNFGKDICEAQRRLVDVAEGKSLRGGHALGAGHR